MLKYVDGAAVCRFELNVRSAHEYPDYALKEDSAIRFRAFFRPEASGVEGFGMCELGISISDFASNESFDCRLECTIVDQQSKVIHKSVCDNWTFERATRAPWSVRVARSVLEDEWRQGKIFADFRLELKPPDGRQHGSNATKVLSPPPPLPPRPPPELPNGNRIQPSAVLSSENEAKDATYYLEVPDIREEIRKSRPLYFDGIAFALRYFTAKVPYGTANFDFVLVNAPNNFAVRLRLHWGLMRKDRTLAFERTIMHNFYNCRCPAECFCAEKIIKCKYFLSNEQLREHAAAHGVKVVVKVRRVDSPPAVPSFTYAPAIHAGGEELPEIHEQPPGKLRGADFERKEAPRATAFGPQSSGANAVPLGDGHNFVPFGKTTTDQSERSWTSWVAPSNGIQAENGGRPHFGRPAGFSTSADLQPPPPKRFRSFEEENGGAKGVVTIEVEGHSFDVDRERLKAESTFFALAMVANENTDFFSVNGITPQQMAAVCEWIQRRAVGGLERMAADLRPVADRLQMPGLKAACDEAIGRKTINSNPAALLVAAVERKDAPMIRSLSFLWKDQEKMMALLNTPEVRAILPTHPTFMDEIYKAMVK
ncbi:hypothetical protein M3Y99_01360400 [Aphelenchoides fujianensis]|nr:hypothetical protein M3Y99_01360400 [Aphelenchoides fujianensis]